MTLTHEPSDYECPFCQLAAGGVTGLTDQNDVVRRAAGATAIMSPHWWSSNPGHVIVAPDAHHENLYSLPSQAGHAVHDLMRDTAVAIRSSYGCEGVTTWQNNEPAGDQDAWHFHVHVIPRYFDDGLYRSDASCHLLASAADRKPYADRIRAYFAAQTPDERQSPTGS